MRSVLKQEKRLEVPNQALPNELEMFQEQARHERFMTTKALLVQRGKGKGEKGKGKPKPKLKDKVGPWSKGEGPKPPRPNPQKEGMCFHCNNEGHCKGNCPQYLEELNGGGASTSSIFVIEVNLSISTSWVLDTGGGSHICSNVQGLRNRKTLAKGEVDLRVGNGARVTALEIGDLDLTLPSGLVILLKNCYYVPSMSRNIISISCLDMDGFSFIIQNNMISIHREGIFYGNGLLSNGLYILNLDDNEPIYNVNTKRIKSNEINPTYFWHCRLGHANEKRISRLHKDGILGSFDTCESCLRGKMTKSPFNKQGERASDLLGLIHTDVCGPLSTTARGGFSYC